MGEARNRELDEANVKQPNDVGDVEFTDNADRALATLRPRPHGGLSERSCTWPETRLGCLKSVSRA
jgi:hypothetical protein